MKVKTMYYAQTSDEEIVFVGVKKVDFDGSDNRVTLSFNNGNTQILYNDGMNLVIEEEGLKED